MAARSSHSSIPITRNLVDFYLWIWTRVLCHSNLGIACSVGMDEQTQEQDRGLSCSHCCGASIHSTCSSRIQFRRKGIVGVQVLHDTCQKLILTCCFSVIFIPMTQYLYVLALYLWFMLVYFVLRRLERCGMKRNGWAWWIISITSATALLIAMVLGFTIWLRGPITPPN
jgi:hypothetical protein